jgi:hypothetical protein
METATMSEADNERGHDALVVRDRVGPHPKRGRAGCVGLAEHSEDVLAPRIELHVHDAAATEVGVDRDGIAQYVLDAHLGDERDVDCEIDERGIERHLRSRALARAEDVDPTLAPEGVQGVGHTACVAAGEGRSCAVALLAERGLVHHGRDLGRRARIGRIKCVRRVGRVTERVTTGLERIARLRAVTVGLRRIRFTLGDVESAEAARKKD